MFMFNFDPTVSILNATICPAINDPFKAIEIAQSIINDSGDGPQYTSYKLLLDMVKYNEAGVANKYTMFVTKNTFLRQSDKQHIMYEVCTEYLGIPYDYLEDFLELTAKQQAAVLQEAQHVYYWPDSFERFYYDYRIGSEPKEFHNAEDDSSIWLTPEEEHKLQIEEDKIFLELTLQKDKRRAYKRALKRTKAKHDAEIVNYNPLFYINKQGVLHLKNDLRKSKEGIRRKSNRKIRYDKTFSQRGNAFKRATLNACWEVL